MLQDSSNRKEIKKSDYEKRDIMEYIPFNGAGSIWTEGNRKKGR